MKVKSRRTDKFVEQLMQLCSLFPRRENELADELGVSFGWFSKVKNGAEPSKTLVAAVKNLHKQNFTLENGPPDQLEEKYSPYGELPPFSRFGGNREGAITDLSSPTPSNYAATLKAVLGPVLFSRALETAAQEGFSDVEEYLRFAIRSQLDVAKEKQVKDDILYRALGGGITSDDPATLAAQETRISESASKRPDMSDPHKAKQAANLKPPEGKK